MNFGILRSLILAAALVPGAWFAWEWRAMPHLSEHHDDGIYYVSARSLAQTGEFRIDSIPGRPAQTKYPPLWPAMLSLAWRIEPNYPANLPWGMALCWVCLPISLYFYRHWLTQAGFGLNETVFLCALWALNPYVIRFSTIMLSELQYTSLLLAGLLCLRDGGPRWAIAAGAVAALAFLSRTAGIAMLPVGIGYYVIRKRYREAATFAAILLPVLLAWILWSGANRSPAKDPISLYYTNYIGYYLATIQWSDLYLYVWKNVDGMVHGLGSILLPDFSHSFLEKVLSETLALAGVIGIVRAVSTNRSSSLTTYSAFSLVYSIMLIVWNFPPNERFILPLAPLWLVGFFLEMKHLSKNVGSVFSKKQFSQKLAGTIVASLGLLVLAFCGVRQWEAVTDGLPQYLRAKATFLSDSEPAIAWIRQNVPVESGVLSQNDPLLFLRTGRRGFKPFPNPIHWYRADETALVAALAEAPGIAQTQRLDYFLLNSSDFASDISPEAHLKLMNALRNDGRLEKVFESGISAVYRVRRP